MSVYGFIVMAWLVGFNGNPPQFQPVPFASVEACQEALKVYKDRGSFACVKTGSPPESLRVGE